MKSETTTKLIFSYQEIANALNLSKIRFIECNMWNNEVIIVLDERVS